MTNQDTEKEQPPSSFLNKVKRFFTIKPSSLDDVSVLLEDALTARLIDKDCLLYTSPSPRDRQKSRMPSSA